MAAARARGGNNHVVEDKGPAMAKRVPASLSPSSRPRSRETPSSSGPGGRRGARAGGGGRRGRGGRQNHCGVRPRGPSSALPSARRRAPWAPAAAASRQALAFREPRLSRGSSTVA